MVRADFFATVAIEIFPEVCAGQLRRGAVGLGLPQPIDVGRIAAIAACGVGGVSAD
jgi:hypothetical protein